MVNHYFGCSYATAVLSAFAALFTACHAHENVVIGVIDGTRRITANDMLNGFNKDRNNYFKPCTQYDYYRDNYVLMLDMGSFREFFIPLPGVTVCALLTNAAEVRDYVCTSQDPRDSTWDGHTHAISTPSSTEAPDILIDGPPGVTNRTTSPSLALARGGLNRTDAHCTVRPGERAAGGGPYRVLLIPMGPTMYLAWGVKPTVVVTNAPVVFEVNVLDRHGIPYEGSITFRITTDGSTFTVTSQTGRYMHYADPPRGVAEKYVITVELLKGPQMVNTRTLRTELNVTGALPSDVTPCSNSNILHLVHFGEKGTSIHSVDKVVALEKDWFAPTVVGGEPQVRPVVGAPAFVRISDDHLVQSVWKNVTSDDGVFTAEVPGGSVQFYAVGLFSAVAQRVIIRYGFDTAAAMYISGRLYTPQHVDPPHEATLEVTLSKGYHQVFVKLFSDQSGTKSRREMRTLSRFWLRAIGTAVGYSLSPVPGAGGAAYELSSAAYLPNLLHLGLKHDDYLHGALSEDLIDVHRVVPKPGAKVGLHTWTLLPFPDGKIPVSAEGLRDGEEAAVSYVAFSIHNDQEDPGSICWSFVTEGKTDFYVDGKLSYFRNNGFGRMEENITSSLTPGWHVFILRIAAMAGHSWSLVFRHHPGDCQVRGDSVPNDSLPFHVFPIEGEAPILALMKLVEKETGVGAIPFDSRNQTAAAIFLEDFPMGPCHNPVPLAVESVWVLGRRLQFQWVVKRAFGGDWGDDTFLGAVNQYWAFGLYATTEMEVGVRVNSHVSNALWMGGSLVGFCLSPSTQECVHNVKLGKGWNQFVIKLRMYNSSNILVVPEGVVSLEEAGQRCSGRDNMRLCSPREICPFGVLPTDSLTASKMPYSFAVDGGEDNWMWASKEQESKTLHCRRGRNGDGNGASKRKNTFLTATTTHLACCISTWQSARWLNINSGYLAESRVGYTYAIPQLPTGSLKGDVETPEGDKGPGRDVQNNASTSRIEGREYTGALFLEQSLYAFRKNSPFTSVNERLSTLVNTNLALSVDRTSCIVYSSCTLKVNGVNSSFSFTLLRTDMDVLIAIKYLDKSYASVQDVSLSFPGVLPIGKNNEVTVPPLGAGTFHIVAFLDGSPGSLSSHVLNYESILLTPSVVEGTQTSVFKAEGGALEPGDAVLMPIESAESPSDCRTDMCFQAFNRHEERVAVIRNSQLAIFMQDLYGYSGNVTCLCVCLSCSTRPYTNAMVRVVRPRVVAFPVDVVVTNSTVYKKEHVAAIRPLIAGNGTAVEIYGKFDTRADHRVIVEFSTVVAADEMKPSCSITRVTENLLVCELQVRTSVIQDLIVLVMAGDALVPFSVGAATHIQAYPSPPQIDFVTGPCASTSAWCVNGTQLTFHGENFNPMGPGYNRVIIEDAEPEGSVVCEVTRVSETTISCTLNVVGNEGEKIYPIGVETRLSESEWGLRRMGGYLVIGAGVFVGGWREDLVKQSAWGKNYQLFMFSCVCTVLGIFTAALVVFQFFHINYVENSETMVQIEETALFPSEMMDFNHDSPEDTCQKKAVLT